jgi:signal transduction histidine kinase
MKDSYLFIASIPIAFISATNLVIPDINRAGDSGVQYSLGSFFYYYIIYLAFLILAGIGALTYKFIKSRGLVKTQILYVLYGTSITALLLLCIDAILPRIVNIRPEVTRIGIYSTSIFVFSVSVAMIKHRLMDIRLVVARSLTYAILLAILALFYAGGVLALERVFFGNQAEATNYGQIALRTILAVIIAFSFQPLRKWITKITDKIFFKHQYNPQKLLDELSHTMGSTILLSQLLYRVTDILIRQMKVSRGLFVLLKEDGSIYTTQTNGYKENPKITADDMVHLLRDGTCVYDELEETSHYKSLLRKYEAAVSIPLKTEKETVGVLLVGEKSSGDMFSQQDLNILEILAPEISVAIENAKSFEEISRFNVTLRQEVRRATHRLKEKNQQLRELDKAKDEFISMASHQLRTPLTAIKGYLSMLLDGDAGEVKVGQYDFIQEAYSGANRMVSLINDLLNISRMETGRFFIEPVEIDVESIVKEEVQQLINQAREKDIYLKIEKKGKIPHIWADETKIRQVIMNFIDNAIHYTQKGRVTVKLGREKGCFVFAVSDTGIGVPESQQPKLFEKFFRAENALHARPDGTGLGIYLAKKVIEDHNGKVFFESVEGKGSTFGFRLPLKKKSVLDSSEFESKPATNNKLTITK